VQPQERASKSAAYSAHRDGGRKGGLLGDTGVMSGRSKDTWASDAVVHMPNTLEGCHTYSVFKVEPDHSSRVSCSASSQSDAKCYCH